MISMKELAEIKKKFEEIYEATVGQHPEVKRLNGRVDELLRANTELLLENRVLKGPINAICVESGRPSINGACQDHGGDACLMDPILSAAERSGAAVAVETLFRALGWNCGGLASAALEIVERYENVKQQRDELQKIVEEADLRPDC